MAISIDWATKVISVPKADTTLVSAGPPEIRSYNVDTDLRVELLALEDNPVGITYDKTHRNVPPTTLSGVTYARFIEIINGYTIEFEDGQYTVQLEGANHNIADIKVANQVSIVVVNSAGLQSVGTALTAEETERLRRLALLHGVEDGSPVTITPTSRSAGDISQTITGDETSTTFSLDP